MPFFKALFGKNGAVYAERDKAGVSLRAVRCRGGGASSVRGGAVALHAAWGACGIQALIALADDFGDERIRRCSALPSRCCSEAPHAACRATAPPRILQCDLPRALVRLSAWGIRRRDQMRGIDQGLCLACGYDLKENTSGVCPECGTATNRNGRSIA